MANLKKLVVLAFLVIAASSVHGSALQQKDSDDDCILRIYQSGRYVILDGTYRSGAHNAFLYIPGCTDPIVIEDPSHLAEKEKAQERIPELHRDSNLETLDSRVKEDPSKGVEVSLFGGRLDVATTVQEGATVKLGLVFDKSGKFLRIYGFGSPGPVYKYRLILIQVNSVSTGKSR